MRIAARAKINWTLDIVGKREDGYHLMDMLMQPISLSDDITLLPQEELTLSVSGFPRVNPGPENLALRAAILLKQATGCTGGCAGRSEPSLGHRLDASGTGNAGLAARCGRAFLSARRTSACAGCRGASHAAALRRALLAGRHSALSGVKHEGSLQSFFIRGL